MNVVKAVIVMWSLMRYLTRNFLVLHLTVNWIDSDSRQFNIVIISGSNNCSEATDKIFH